jgi:hypothetical protein
MAPQDQDFEKPNRREISEFKPFEDDDIATENTENYDNTDEKNKQQVIEISSFFYEN